LGISITTIYNIAILISSYLETIESELQHRLPYKYVWYRKQNDVWDRYSNFIYRTVNWEDLMPKISETISRLKIDENEFFYYTINRWYNYWSALAVELIFADLDGVVPEKNKKNKQTDFCLFGEKFDHKTSVFPKGFHKSLGYARKHPIELIQWLYNKPKSTTKKTFRKQVVCHCIC